MKYNTLFVIFAVLILFFMFKKKEHFNDILLYNSRDDKSTDPRRKSFVDFSWQRWNKKNEGWFDKNEPELFKYKRVWPD